MSGRNITLIGGTAAAAALAALGLLAPPALAQTAQPLPPAAPPRGGSPVSLWASSGIFRNAPAPATASP